MEFKDKLELFINEKVGEGYEILKIHISFNANKILNTKYFQNNNRSVPKYIESMLGYKAVVDLHIKDTAVLIEMREPKAGIIISDVITA